MARHELQWLLKEAQKLEHIIAEGERFLEKAPAGTLQIRPHNQGVQYYHRSEKETRSGIYLPKKNMILIKGLAQKRYFEKVLPVAYKQLKEIQRFLENYDPDALKVVYQKEGMERQKLIRAVDILMLYLPKPGWLRNMNTRPLQRIRRPILHKRMSVFGLNLRC